MLLSGEAGIGKSRLTAALLEHLTGEPHTRLRYFCSPQHTDSAFYPIIGQLERAAGMAHDDTAQAKLDKLDALLAQTSTSMQDAVLFAEMLSLPNDGRYPALDLTPEQRRQRTLDALIAQTEVLTRQNPVLMIFEDAHWTDPTSLELFGRAVDRIAKLPSTADRDVPAGIRAALDRATSRDRPHHQSADATRHRRHDRPGRRQQAPSGERQAGHHRAHRRHSLVRRGDHQGGAGGGERERSAADCWRGSVPGRGRPRELARLADGAARPAWPAPRRWRRSGRRSGGNSRMPYWRRSCASRRRSWARRWIVSFKPVCCSGRACRRTRPTCLEHALVQDAAYGTLLREPRRALHARIAETLETQFTETAETQPELLARHCTEAGLIEKAAGLWGKAGERSLARSALVEAAEQLTRALDQIATLPGTPALRREQIKLQVALITPLIHVKGYAAPETKASAERARLLIEQAEALGQPPEDPLLLFSVLYGFWAANVIAFNGDVARELAAQFLSLAEKQGATVPLMVGHRLMGFSLMLTGDIAEGRGHLDQAIALYDPAEHHPLATRFGQDVRVAILSHRSMALWLLGYPEAALRDADDALKDAREIGQAATVMFALNFAVFTHFFCGNYATATALVDELVALADQKGALYWKALGTAYQGCVLALTGKAADAIHVITSGIAAYRSTGATVYTPFWLSILAKAYAELGQFDDARRCIGEATTAVETTKETWCEAEIHRIAGEIALKSPVPDAAKAEAYFERALAVARKQQAKSWELRAAMSMARLWRDQGKREQARDLLAPVYGWFTEGFDTLDLKEAKALLDELHA